MCKRRVQPITILRTHHNLARNCFLYAANMCFLYAADIRFVSFILTEYWASKIQEYQPWLQQEMQFGTDESKRVKPGKAKANSNNEGSFRKLDID